MMDSILDIDDKIIEKYNIKGIVLDVDNTLAPYGCPDPLDGVIEWIECMNNKGIKLMIVSNNFQKRVKPFADKLGLEFVSMSCKPLTFGMTRACKHLGVDKKSIAIVGDQIFTDILTGNLKGVHSFLVSPIKLENSLLFKFKRLFENRVIKKYQKSVNERRD